MSERKLVLDSETTGMAWENGHRVIELGIVELIDRKLTGNNYHVFLDPGREVEEGAEEVHGWNWENGHRVIELGIVELIDRKLTGNNYHVFLDPGREVEEGAEEVHGWNWENLKIQSEGKKFSDIARGLLDYIDGDELVIHNAPFDMGHLDAEFRRLGWPELTGTVRVTDTLVKANNMYPGRRNNLDSLSARLGIDTSSRTLHGALLDAEILADVYLVMTTKQHAMNLDRSSEPSVSIPSSSKSRVSFTPLPKDLTDKLVVASPSSDELQAHRDMMQKIQSSSGNEGMSF